MCYIPAQFLGGILGESIARFMMAVVECPVILEKPWDVERLQQDGS
jgi:hypothetical protein